MKRQRNQRRIKGGCRPVVRCPRFADDKERKRLGQGAISSNKIFLLEKTPIGSPNLA